MKTIYKIAKTELKSLFFSPIAWLIIIIFTFQASIVFTGIFEGSVRRQALGFSLQNLTLDTFAGMKGLFTIIQNYLYLYIPLLTMGIMSREFSSGSIKLLYSSPLTNQQIILGKYLALVIFALILVGFLSLFGIYGIATIDQVDIPVILTGLLGVFLLICAYSAIGLFMSSLTSYTVVAAMGTLTIFAFLSYVKGIGQDVEFVRDITYWLAISGRSNTFVSGLITSEDVLYFLIVISLFLSLTIIKLQVDREKSRWLITFGKYMSVVSIAMLLGYFSSMPKLMSYIDVTRTKVNTLTKSSQDVIARLNGGLSINTYTNMLDVNSWIALPTSIKKDADLFKQYLRFKPEIKLNYIYYYHKTKNPHLDKQYSNLTDEQRIDTLRKIRNWSFDIKAYKDIKEVDLAPENFYFVRSLERENGKQSFLRIYDDMQLFPMESEITAAFKRLAMDRLPTVGFLTGHGERSNHAEEDRGYSMFTQEKTFRYALVNQGFDFENVSLDKDIPDHIQILVIGEVTKVINAEEMDILNRYIRNGGNLIIAGEPGRQEFMNPVVKQLGVEFLPGMLVKPTSKFQSNLLLLEPTGAALEFSHYFEDMKRRKRVLTMPTAGALKYSNDKGFDITTLFTSDSTGGWNELETTNFIDDSVRLNLEASEVEKAYPTVIALSRMVKSKEQKIMITGDADWLSNGELMMNRKDIKAANFSLINAAFSWLTDGEVPIDMRRPIPVDQSLNIGQKGWAISSIALKWLLPLLLVLAGTLIWIRRKGR